MSDCPLPQEIKTYLPIHVVQKITIIHVQKFGKSAVEIWYSVSGGGEKCLNMDAQLQTIPYEMRPKGLKKLHGLIAFRYAQTVPPVRTWQFLVAPCNELAKYFYTGAHLHTCGKNAVIEFFFQLAFDVVRTNFAPIFSDFENFLGRSATNRSAT